MYRPGPDSAFRRTSPLTRLALVAAVGSGSRLGGDLPKALRELGGVPLVRRSVQQLAAGKVPVAGKPKPATYGEGGDVDAYRAMLAKGGLDGVIVATTDGGKSWRRQFDGRKANEAVLAAAKSAGVPVVGMTETLPAGLDYVGWMQRNLDAVGGALQG